MPSVPLFLFLLCAFLVFYTYVAFPFLLQLLFRKKSKLIADADFHPPVTVIMSVYNEEKVLAEKLNGILASEYSGAISVLIGSDASDDGTNLILKTFAEKDRRIRFYIHEQRRGKPAMINELVAKAESELIILTDANVFFEKDTISKLVERFADEKIGLVGATIYNSGVKHDGISHQEKTYIQRENLIKYREGEIFGSMMGPFGGCYALRKSLYEAVPSNFLVDDFYISMVVLEKGFQCVNSLHAICYEDVSNEIEQEYRRKARISAGNFQNLNRFSKFLLQPFSGIGFCFISHKVLRWFTPFFILISFFSLLFLWNSNVIFQILFSAQALVLISPVIDKLFALLHVHVRLLRFVSYFILMNVALLQGFFRFINGVKSGVWTPTKRVV